MCTMRFGNMFEMLGKEPLYVTCNGYVRKDSRLVMGAGAAKALTVLCPGIDAVFGNRIILKGVLVPNPAGWSYRYGSAWDMSENVGALQTKMHWKDRADPELIKHGLANISARRTRLHQDIIHINYPGIGLGNLTTDVVEPLLEVYDDWLHVWRPL